PTRTRSRACSASSARCASSTHRRKACSRACSEADMGIFDFLRARNKNTAAIAKERLRIIVAQERSQRGAPDYLPLLRRELLEVIKKYVNVDQNAIDIHVERDGDHDVLELSVALPDKTAAAVAAGGA